MSVIVQLALAIGLACEGDLRYVKGGRYFRGGGGLLVCVETSSC